MLREFPHPIAIDGPAASGKTTIGRQLADKLGYLLLDTGIMYRAATLAVLRHGVDPADEAAVVNIAQALDLQIKPADHDDGRSNTVVLDGEDVTWDLRSPAVEAHVSQVSKYGGVRREMVRHQRSIAAEGHFVVVGRDIGTVVLPDAPCKLYITASAEERARRRLADRQAQGNHAEGYEAILADIERRDRIDSNRQNSPLRAADDAIVIDTSEQTPAQILDYILTLFPAPVVNNGNAP